MTAMAQEGENNQNAPGDHNSTRILVETEERSKDTPGDTGNIPRSQRVVPLTRAGEPGFWFPREYAENALECAKERELLEDRLAKEKELRRSCETDLREITKETKRTAEKAENTKRELDRIRLSRDRWRKVAIGSIGILIVETAILFLIR